jgi:heme exporter protein A
MDSALEVLAVREVSKRYGALSVLSKLSLSFQPGEVVLLLGANGAGKTTFLRIVAGLSRPSAGTVKRPSSWRSGVAAHHSFLYGRLTLIENMRMYAALLNVSSHECDALVSHWGLADFMSTPVSELSKGTTAKASLIRALLGDPEVLLFDEPSSNLDERGVAALREALVRQKQKGVALVATHDVSRLYEVANRIVVLERGVCVADSGSQCSEEALEKVVKVYHEGNR